MKSASEEIVFQKTLYHTNNVLGSVWKVLWGMVSRQISTNRQGFGAGAETTNDKRVLSRLSVKLYGLI